MKNQCKLLFFLCCVPALMLTDCSKGQLKKQVQEPEAPNCELEGQVKQMIETDHTLLTPDLFAFNQADFPIEQLVDYQYQKMAAQIYNEAEGVDEEDEDDFYYYMPWAERYFNGEDEMETFAYTLENYDKDGYLLFYGTYNDPNQMGYKQIFTRDENHRLLKEENYKRDVLVFSGEFQYNEDGFITRSLCRTDEGTKEKTLYTYDELNYLMYYEVFRNDTFYSRLTQTYDQYGNTLTEQSTGSWDCKWEYKYLYGRGKKRDLITEETYYSPCDQLVNRYINHYSDDLSERDEYQLNERGDTTSHHHYRFDDQMRLLSDVCTLFPEGGYTLRIEYDERGNMILNENEAWQPHSYHLETVVYDDQNRETERTDFNTNNGPLAKRTVTSYDQQGHMIQAETFLSVKTDEGMTPERLSVRETWQYDAQGNWINHETYYFTVDQSAADKGHLIGKETREIEYY